MKHINRIFRNIFSLIAIAAIFVSCADKITMETFINSDGSCSREILFERDSLGNIKGNYPHVTDTLPRSFASVEEMAAAYPLEINGKKILKDAKFEKRFRFFFTEYKYTEIYEDFSTDFGVPISKYLDEDAAGFWLTGEPNIFAGYSGYEQSEYLEEMSDKFGKWVSANIVYDAAEISQKYLPEEEIFSQRDSLINYAIQRGFSFNMESSKIGEILTGFFHNEKLAELWAEDGAAADELSNLFNKKYLELSSLNVDYRLSMPGASAKIVDCDKGTLAEHGYKSGIFGYNITVCYRLNGIRLLAGNYTISATSRETNLWAYILTALLLALLFAGWRVAAGRRRR